MAQVSAELQLIRQLIESRDKLDEQRRKTDDERNSSAEEGRKGIISRIDGHGRRLAKVETYFSEGGAFPIFSKVQHSQGKKIDRLTWLVAIGVGIVLTLQFVMLLKH